MSTSDRRRHQQRRPTTIAELSERALDNLYDESKPLKHYLRVAERYRKDARDYYSKGDLENAFILFARAATLVLDKLPTHREFYTLLNLIQRNNLHMNGTDILEDLGELKRKLTKRYEDWVRDHPEEELKTSTSASTSGANDVDLSMRRTRSKGKERERGRHSNQRRIQEEYSLWRQDDYDYEDIDELAERERRRNRERDPVRDRGVFVVPQPSPHDREAKKEAAVAAAREAASASQAIPVLDYTFSRPPLQSQNGYTNIARGTPVPDGNDEGRRYMESERQYLYEQQQKAMRHRQEEILRKREDQRRTREQEDILRRQKEVDDATHTARPASRTINNSGARAAQGSVASIAAVPSPAPPATSFYQAPPTVSTPFYAPAQGSSSTSVLAMPPRSYPTPGSSLTTVMYANTRNSSPTRPQPVATMPGPDHPRMEISRAPSQSRQITPPQVPQQAPASQAPSQVSQVSLPRPSSRDPPPVPSPHPPTFIEGGPTLLPIQPARLEGDSTDTESVYSTNLRRDESQRLYPEYLQTRGRAELQRTPTRSKIRSPSPVTTTSPPPPEVGRSILYPQLMSQHQKKQGYYPSSNSMFAFSEAPRVMYQSINNDPRQQHSNNASSGTLYGSASEILYNQQKYQQGSAPYPYRPTQQPSPSSSSSSSSQPRLSFPGLPQPVTAVPLPTPPIYASIPTSADRFVHGLPPPPPPPPPSSRSQQPSYPRQARGLKTVTLPKEVLPRFLAIAKVNTAMNRETCGLLLGKDKSSKFAVTTLLIPRQHSTSDTCAMDEEELVLQFTEERSLITLGWIHTHPSQSCFMSSVDLHTHSGFQRMLPESFAVVCAPKSTPNYGIFRLTDPPGLKAILDCREKDAFHPHPDVPIYTDADKGHVQIKEGAPLEIVDLR